MDKKKLIIIASAVVITAFAIVYFCAIRPAMADGDVHIQEKIHLLKEETVPLRFKIVQHANGEMLIAAKFYNLDGKAVGRFEAPFNNNGPIAIHFADVDIKGNHVIFPSAMDIADGDSEIDLLPYYSDGGVPHVYDSDLMDPQLMAEVSKIFRMLCDGREDDVEDLYGNVCVLSTYINHPCERVNYEVRTTSSGKVYFID